MRSEEYQTWQHRIKEGLEFVEALREGSRLYREAFSGRFPNVMPDEDPSELVTPNRVQRVVNQWIGAMYAYHPRIWLEPPGWTNEDVRRKVALNEAIINAEIRRLRTDVAVRRALQSAFLDGWGWVKVGFHTDLSDPVEGVGERIADWRVENHGFEMGEEFTPVEVSVDEPHEQHLAGHQGLKDRVTMTLNQIVQKIQMMQQQAMQQGVELPLDPGIQQEVMRLQQMLQAIDLHIDLHHQKRTERDRRGSLNTDTRVPLESCWLTHVHNSNVIWDQYATTPYDWRWVAERFVRPLGEWKRSSKLRGKEHLTVNYNQIKPGARGDQHGEGVRSATLETTRGSDDEDGLCSVWKIWDVEHRRIIYLHEPMEKPLHVETWPHDFVYGPPHKMLFFETEEDEFIPISPVSRFWTQQVELIRARTKAGVVSRRLNRVIIANSKVSPEDLDKIQRARDMEVVHLSGDVDVRQAIGPLEFGNVPFDVYQMANTAKDDMEVDSGLGEVVLGSGVRAKTATAADVQKQASTVPLDLKLACVENWVGDWVKDLRALMRQYYSDPRYVELFWEGAKIMEAWTGDDLEDFDVRVEMGSSMRDKKAMDIMQWSQAVQLLSGAPGINLQWLARRYLEKLGVRNPDEAFLTALEQLPQSPGPPIGGPGQGQNQTVNPERQEAPTAGRAAQPGQDPTKP